jgi:hypothetical protein
VYSTGWYFLDGVDVLTPRTAGAIVGFGDSITDGFEGNKEELIENPAGKTPTAAGRMISVAAC